MGGVGGGLGAGGIMGTGPGILSNPNMLPPPTGGPPMSGPPSSIMGQGPPLGPPPALGPSGGPLNPNERAMVEKQLETLRATRGIRYSWSASEGAYLVMMQDRDMRNDRLVRITSMDQLFELC